MIMMDTIRRGELPDGVAVLQVKPCTETVAPAGQRIFCLWAGPDVEAVSSDVQSTIGEFCTSTLFPVLEDHCHGVSKESLDEKLERVARTTGRKIKALDDKLGVTEGVTAATAVTVAVWNRGERGGRTSEPEHERGGWGGKIVGFVGSAPSPTHPPEFLLTKVLVVCTFHFCAVWILSLIHI